MNRVLLAPGAVPSQNAIHPIDMQVGQRRIILRPE